MRRTALFLALLALASLARMSFLHHLELIGAAPDLVLVLVACWALVWGSGEAMALAPLAGAVADLLGEGPVGLSVLGLTPVVLLAGARETGLMEATLPLALGMVALGTLGRYVLVLTALTVMGRGLPWGEAMLVAALPEVAVNVLLAPLVYLPLRLLYPVLGPQPERLTLGR